MKKFTILLGLSIIYLCANAQYELDHTFTDQTIYEVSYVELENSGKKLYTTNLDGETYKLQFFNIDYSPYKTITINLGPIFQFDYTEFDFYVYYLSEHLFDTDNEIEFLAELYYIDNSDNEYSQVLVFNENGATLFESDIVNNNSWILWPSQNGSTTMGNGIPGSIHNTSDGTKMVLGLYDFVDTIYKYEVYNLPGTLSTSTLKGITAPEGANLKAYPNPAKSAFTIDYELIEGENKSELLIYNMNGEIIKRIDVNNNKGRISISTDDMPAGSYVYQMGSKQKGYTRRKLIIKE